jgi:hypothetical protein
MSRGEGQTPRHSKRPEVDSPYSEGQSRHTKTEYQDLPPMGSRKKILQRDAEEAQTQWPAFLRRRWLHFCCKKCGWYAFVYICFSFYIPHSLIFFIFYFSQTDWKKQNFNLRVEERYFQSSRDHYYHRRCKYVHSCKCKRTCKQKILSRS